MPEMDGIQATRIIRNDLGITSLPIVAVTAHTMAGDREECLRAGMNAYLPKPIDREQLFRIIQKMLPQVSGFGPLFAATEAEPPKSAEDQLGPLPGLDVAEGLTRIGGSTTLYVEIIKEYCETNRNFVPEFKTLLAQDDFAAARMKVHALKGAAGNISAKALYRAAGALEEACAKQDPEKIEQHLSELTRELQVIMKSARQLNNRA